MTTETVEKTAAELVAEAMLARTSGAGVLSMLILDMKAVDDVSSTAGYENALEVAKAIGLTQSELALWMEPEARSKPDAIGSAVNQRHDQIAPKHGPTRRNVVSVALQLAVDAMPQDEAEEAKKGTGTTKYPLVPNAHGPTKDNQKNAPLTGHKAYAELHKRWTDAATPNSDGEPKDADLAAIYRQACECAVSDDDIPQDEIDRLGSARAVRIDRVRALAADKQARTVNGGRFRSILFLPLIEEELTTFAKTSNGRKSIGSVWSDAAAKTRSAHAEYMSKLPKGTAVDVATMVEGMRKAAHDYLLGKSGTKVGTVKENAEKVENAAAAMFSNARKLFDLEAIPDNFGDALLDAIAKGLFNDGQFLTAVGVVMGCANLKTKELERRQKEEEERAAKAAREEEDRAEQERKRVEREQKKAQAVADAKAAAEAKVKLAKDQAEIDAAKEATVKANAKQDEATVNAAAETAEERVARKQAAKKAAA